MTLPNAPARSPITSRWSSRIALFCFGLLITTFVLHRFFGLTTPVAGLLVKVVVGGALMSVGLALVATIGIWRRDLPGTSRIVFGITLSVLLMLGPLMLWLLELQHPAIYDVTTDTVDPPPFSVVSGQRTFGTHATDYPGAAFAAVQKSAYPDIKPIRIERSADEAFELAVDAVKRMRMQVVREEAPGEAIARGNASDDQTSDAASGDGKAGDKAAADRKSSKGKAQTDARVAEVVAPEPVEPATPAVGYIEATDRTIIMGFYDDVALRVTGDDREARIDMRSASRFGASDMGRNAERLRELQHEIRLRVEATMPIAGEEKENRAKKKQERASKGKDGGQKSDGRRRPQDRGQ